MLTIEIFGKLYKGCTHGVLLILVLWFFLGGCKPQKTKQIDRGRKDSAQDSLAKQGNLLKVRQLSPLELDNIASEFLQSEFNSYSSRLALDGDEHSVFGNESLFQSVNSQRIYQMQDIVSDIAQRLLGEQKIDQIAGSSACQAANNVQSCLQALLENAAKRLLKPELIDSMAGQITVTASSLAANSELGFDEKKLAAMQWILLHPYAVHHIEGQALTRSDKLHRLSYFLWGRPPDQEIMASQQEFKELIEKMVLSEKFNSHVAQIIYGWLDMEPVMTSGDPLISALALESRELIQNVVASDQSWRKLLRNTKGYWSGQLAAHYGYPFEIASGEGFIELKQARGLLHHGSVLSRSLDKDLQVKITQRGQFLVQRLLCDQVSNPSIDTTAIDTKKFTTSPCAADLMLAIGKQPGCGHCHNMADSLGLVAFRFDNLGSYRATEPGLDQCSTVQPGEHPKIGSFKDIDEFIGKAFETNILDECFVRHVIAYAKGVQQRHVKPQDVQAVGVNPELSIRSIMKSAAHFLIEEASY